MLFIIFPPRRYLALFSSIHEEYHGSKFVSAFKTKQELRFPIMTLDYVR